MVFKVVAREENLIVRTAGLAGFLALIVLEPALCV